MIIINTIVRGLTRRVEIVGGGGGKLVKNRGITVIVHVSVSPV